MRRYLLDTGILVHYVRQSPHYKTIEANENLTAQDCIPFISVVTMGEILSFGIQHSWGPAKVQSLKALFSKLVVLDINSSDNKLLDAYAEIDSFSKNKLSYNQLGRSITMGKNDLWIAATAKVANATLLTIDGDFDHLNGTFLAIKKNIDFCGRRMQDVILLLSYMGRNSTLITLGLKDSLHLL